MSTEPRWIEIVGVAGAGKSTLARTLEERHPNYRIADSLHTSLPTHWRYVAHSVPLVVPPLARAALHRPVPSWDEVKFVVYVAEWSRFLATRREYRLGTTVLDQGPIFALARLLWGGKPVTRSPRFQAWVGEMVESWSARLDAIVLLDAPIDTLLERINHRDQHHEAKGSATEEARRVIASHRRAYEHVLEQFDRLGRPPVLRFDTSTMPPVDIADELADGGSARVLDGSSASVQRAVGSPSAFDPAERLR